VPQVIDRQRYFADYQRPDEATALEEVLDDLVAVWW
jgi:hypothetical protein